MPKFTIAAFLLLNGAFGAMEAQGVTIMTQNMDAGTDESFVLEFASTQPKLGVDLTLAEIVASKIPERANLLAGRIAAEKPDLVGLQEVTLWRVGLTSETANIVLYDQLELLLHALSARGVPYQVVAVNSLTDIALPATFGAVRITDRDALLVRADLRPPIVQISNAQTHVFSASFPFEGFQALSGWISTDVKADSRQFKFITTHLMSSIPGIPQSTVVQVAQVGELIDALRGVTEPIVVSGDFNSDANFGNGPDATPSVALIEAGGYTDDWKSANPGDSGPTWPLYVQDQTPPKFFAPSTPFERIDLFFSKGISVVSEERIFAPAPFGLPDFGSDHAGVLASFRP